MENIDTILTYLRTYLPFLMLIGIPFGVYGMLRMLFFKKYKLLGISIILFITFFISRYMATNILPLDMKSLDTFLKNMNNFEMSIIIIFMLIGLTIGTRKKCPNCKSIDHVKKLSKRLISRENLGRDIAHNGAGQRGGHSVIRQRVKETYETNYQCNNCNHKWSVQTQSNKTNQHVNTY